MNASFMRASIYPFALALRGELLEYHRELRTLHQLQRDAVALEQLRRLRVDQLLVAAREVPYYKALPASLGPARDAGQLLNGFPLLTKSDLQESFQALQNPRIRRRSRKTTGGSTGQAVTVLKNPRAVARERAASAMGYAWFGIRMGDPALRFWGSSSTAGRKAKSRLADAAMNRKSVSAFAFNGDDLDRYWDLCVAFKPAYFYGYASMLEEFARHVRQKGLEGHLPGLRAIISTSEPLTAPRREVIRQAFNVPVQNEYGCGEVGPIAYECRAGSLHVMSQSLEVEILSDTGEPCRPGVVGQVVVTDLNNHAFPLIRYAIGDHAAWGRPCACGLPFPVLAELLGRQYDYLEDGAGRRYHGEAVMYIFEDLREEGFDIPAFQVLQHRPGEARLLLVAPTAPARLDEKLREMFRIRLGQMELKIERRDEIPRASSGKRRLIHRLS